MPLERPLLTARWTELVMLNFAVPREVLAQLAPAGTEPDLYDGQAYASVIGFLFRDARFLGLRFPGHGRFEEVNLRYYVCRHIDTVMARSPDHAIDGVCARSGDPRTTHAGSGDPRTMHAGSGDPHTTQGDPRTTDRVGGQIRRGVVFVREIAPRAAVAAVARWIYNESYVTRRMRSEVQLAGHHLAAGDQVGYEWQTGRWPHRTWNRLAARAADWPRLPRAGSLEEFIVEHYWAYVRGGDGSTWEYRVAHRPWRVAPAAEVVWDCDVEATYGVSPLAPYLAKPPVMAMIADGSPVQVFHGRRLESQDDPLRGCPGAESQEPETCSTLDSLGTGGSEATVSARRGGNKSRTNAPLASIIRLNSAGTSTSVKIVESNSPPKTTLPSPR